MPRFLAALFCAALLLPPIAASAQAVPMPERRLTLDVQNTDLHSAVNTLVHQTGVQAIVQGGKTPFQPVNVHLSGVTPSQALREVAASAGAKVTKTSDGIYILTLFDDFPSLNYRTILLQHANPADILKAMKWGMDEFVSKTEAAKPLNTNLPEGVVRIFALRSNNSLLIQATNEGYARVKDIVKTLDIAPLRVQMKVTLAAIPSTLKLTVDLTQPGQALLQLRRTKASFYEPNPLTDNGQQCSGSASRRMAVPRPCSCAEKWRHRKRIVVQPCSNAANYLGRYGHAIRRDERDIS